MSVQQYAAHLSLPLSTFDTKLTVIEPEGFVGDVCVLVGTVAVVEVVVSVGIVNVGFSSEKDLPTGSEVMYFETYFCRTVAS